MIVAQVFKARVNRHDSRGSIPPTTRHKIYHFSSWIFITNSKVFVVFKQNTDSFQSSLIVLNFHAKILYNIKKNVIVQKSYGHVSGRI